jgi:spore photoproduct lyase
MIKYDIARLLIDRPLLDHPYACHVCDQFPDAEIIPLDSGNVPHQKTSLTWNKHTIHLTTFPGSFIKDCPATGAPYLCCQYRILSSIIGCPIDCSYCILQHYLGAQPIRVFVNWEDMYAQVRDYVVKYPDRLIRIGSGELADSLAMEPWLGMAKAWIPFFARFPNAVLELKTKTANIEWLASVHHGGRTVIGWSLNPSTIAASEERGSAPVEDRIRAASDVVAMGYKVAFHFDPILTYTWWEELYRELIRRLCSAVPASSVAWVSLGSLRFPPPLRGIIRRRFPKSRILDGEWILGRDGKCRLIKPLRVDIFRKVYRWLREGWGDDVYIYLCMESGGVWRESLGWEPISRDEIERKFQEYWEMKYGKKSYGNGKSC